MPQLRIHFTDADLARTRLHLEIDLMWEIVGSVQALQHTGGDLPLLPWRRRVRELAGEDSSFRAALRTLTAVAPQAAYFPDFLTPTLDVPDFGAAVDAVLSTPARRLCEETERLRPAGWPEARWLADLARGSPAALQQLRQALGIYYRLVIEPHLPVIGSGLHFDRAERIQHYLRTGPEGLLRRLGRGTTWQPPVLSVDYPHDRTLHLRGRGLLLIPSYFCVYHPVTLANPRLRPILVFPIRTEARLLAAGRDGGDHVSALLGPTRAAILRSAVSSSTTTTLARKAGVTRATVSHHTNILRDAGLITTARHRNFATHRITVLGLEVLASGSDGVR